MLVNATKEVQRIASNDGLLLAAGGEGGAKTSHLEMAETECNQMKSLILVMLGENTSGFRQVVCPTFPSSRQFLGREGKLQFQKLLVTLSTCFSRMNLWEK